MPVPKGGWGTLNGEDEMLHKIAQRVVNTLPSVVIAVQDVHPRSIDDQGIGASDRIVGYNVGIPPIHEQRLVPDRIVQGRCRQGVAVRPADLTLFVSSATERKNKACLTKGTGSMKGRLPS